MASYYYSSVLPPMINIGHAMTNAPSDISEVDIRMLVVKGMDRL
jgi:hypothetical protein